MKKRILTLLLTLFLLSAPSVMAHDGIIHTGCTDPGTIHTGFTDGTIHTGLTADGIIQNGFSDGVIWPMFSDGVIIAWFINGIIQNG
jgi:hypothetical protein